MATQMSRPDIVKEYLIFIPTAFMMAWDLPPWLLNLSHSSLPGAVFENSQGAHSCSQ